jgi:hypothetical protein
MTFQDVDAFLFTQGRAHHVVVNYFAAINIEVVIHLFKLQAGKGCSENPFRELVWF